MSLARVGPLLLGLFACGAGDEGTTTAGDDPAEEACYQIAEGTIVDGGASPDSAPVLEPGPDPWRVVLIPDASTYVRFPTGAGTLVLTSDVEAAIASVTTDGEAVELPPSEVNPHCTQDLLTLLEVPVGSGEQVVEIADHYKASVWLVGALR